MDWRAGDYHQYYLRHLSGFCQQPFDSTSGSFLFSRQEKEPLERNAAHEMAAHHKTTAFEEKLMFILGFMGLLAVPVFKYFTHLPPYMGILLSVGILWYVTDLLHRHKEAETRHQFSVGAILHRIDTPTVLFFLGILLAVGSLDVSGHLHDIADALNHHFGNIYAITGFIGILSSIVDNVPLVAASMGMYDLSTFLRIILSGNYWRIVLELVEVCLSLDLLQALHPWASSRSIFCGI